MTQQDSILMLKTAFERYFGIHRASVTALPGSGSNRWYYRLGGDNCSAIGAVADDAVEAKAFVALSEVFKRFALPIPEILEVSTPTVYLQEDLGDENLFKLIAEGSEGDLPERVMRLLPAMQRVPYEDWAGAVAFNPFGKRLVMWDLNYFKYEFLKVSGIVFDEDLLEDDFEALASGLCSMPESGLGFMWRDCQSRNVMIKDGNPSFIDYQGGRKGPGLYDAVSFAWQAKAKFSHERRMSLVRIYAEELFRHGGPTLESTLEFLPLFVVFRTLQVLGAYGFRGLVEHKAHFVESIPAALDNLKEIISFGWFDAFPELKRVVEGLCSLEKFSHREEKSGLRVSVFSFSYKKGYPEDLSGNGGGFMFDCRGMHNPGRYDEYKLLTGLDKPVRNFLEERGEVQKFVEDAYSLTSKSVAAYMRRGFKNLQIGFGCTGGQHRSVYSAQALAERIANDYPDVVVDLFHREQGIHQVFNE